MAAARKATPPAAGKVAGGTPSKIRFKTGHVDITSGTWIPYAVPWAAVVVVYVVGQVAHLAWGRAGDRQTMVALTIELLAGALAVFTYALAKPRNPLVRGLATLTVVMVGAGLIVLLVFGTSVGSFTAFILPAVAVAAGWNITRIPAVRGYGGEGDAKGSGLDDLLRLPGAKSRVVSVGDDQTVLEITTAGTQGFRDVQKSADAIANIVDLPPGAVRVQQGDPDRGRLVMQRRSGPLEGLARLLRGKSEERAERQQDRGGDSRRFGGKEPQETGSLRCARFGRHRLGIHSRNRQDRWSNRMDVKGAENI